jgi:ribosome maturation protein Sdo1
MRFQRPKKTEEAAKRAVDTLIETGDIYRFISRIAVYSGSITRYSYKNRDLFIDELKRQIYNRGIKLTE